MTLTNADILSRQPSLADCSSKAKGGTTTSAICSKLERVYPNDELINWYICFLNGANKGIDRLVTGSDKQSGEIFFDTLDTTIDANTQIAILEDGYLHFADEAESILTNKFRNNGLDISLFLDNSDLKELHLVTALSLIFDNLYNDATSDDSYYNKMIEYKQQSELLFSSLRADYDVDENGEISEVEENTKVTQIGFDR